MLSYASPSDLPMTEGPRLPPRMVLLIDWAQSFPGNRPSITEPTYIVREFFGRLPQILTEQFLIFFHKNTIFIDFSYYIWYILTVTKERSTDCKTRQRMNTIAEPIFGKE